MLHCYRCHKKHGNFFLLYANATEELEIMCERVDVLGRPVGVFQYSNYGFELLKQVDEYDEEECSVALWPLIPFIKNITVPL